MTARSTVVMMKILVSIILGVLIGLGAAALSGRLWSPVGRRSPRPNRPKAGNWQTAVIVGGAVLCGLLAWLGLGHLLWSERPVTDKPGNAVTRPVGPKADEPRKPLVAMTPMHQSAQRVSPVAGSLERVGLVLALTHPPVGPTLKKTAQPEKKPAAGEEPAGETAKPAASASESETPPPSASTAQPGAETEAEAKFTIHLASFSDKANADRNLARLKAAGVPAFIAGVRLESGQWYRLMAGRFPTEAAARRYADELKKKGLTADTGPFVIRPLPK